MNSTLKKTTDYDKFEVHECNRPERMNPHLAQSMKEHGFMPSGAIHVKQNGNGKLKIIRGHHRFSEAQRQGLPVYYIEDNTNTDIFDLEGSSRQTWSMRDFVEARARDGDQNYIKLLEFQHEHKIALAACAALLSGASPGATHFIKKVKDGTFKIKHTKHAELVVGIIDQCLDAGIRFAKQRSFVSAVSGACRVPEFDVDKFISTIKKYPEMMNNRSTTDEYLEEIEGAYNYRARNRLPLTFKVREIMRSRGRKKSLPK